LLETAANAQRNISPGLAHPQYLHSIIHEELPKVNDDFRKGTRRSDRRPQGKENGGFIDAIKNLDKHALNMYTALRAELGTRELSWFALISEFYRRTEMPKGFRRNGGNEQDYWN